MPGGVSNVRINTYRTRFDTTPLPLSGRNSASHCWRKISATAGLAVAIPAYAGYNYLVSRVNAIVLDMEKASTEMLNYLGDSVSGNKPT